MTPPVLFPFLFGGTFIEGWAARREEHDDLDFPSFSEGLSLRVFNNPGVKAVRPEFPFLFGGTFIEG